MPLMIKFAASDKFALEFGPQLGFLLSAKSEGKETFDGSTETFDDDIKDFVKSIDFGLNFGVSFDVAENMIVYP
jgi:hypothetical protein